MNKLTLVILSGIIGIGVFLVRYYLKHGYLGSTAMMVTGILILIFSIILFLMRKSLR